MLQVALARYLASKGHGTYGTTSASLFVGELPATPADAVAIQSKTAPPGDYSENKIRGVQIIVRTSGQTGGRARSGYQKAIAIRDELHGLTHTLLDPEGPDEEHVSWIRSDGDDPVNLGDDANGRPRWSLRFVAQTRAVTARTIL